MKAFFVLAILSASIAQFCKAEKGFPETPAGELEAIECPEKLFRDTHWIPQWGYIAKLCSPSTNPIWIDVADICTPVRKLTHPPYGSLFMDYEVEITNFNNNTFVPKYKFLMDNALFNKTIEYVVKPIDVIVTDVQTGEKDGKETAILTIHQRVDTSYKAEVIAFVKEIFNNGEVLEMLQEYDDVFLGCDLYIHEDSLRFTKFNIFYNPYFQIIFWTAIVCIIWAIFCRIGRKTCCRKQEEALLNQV